jgi:hypothetical protein
MGHLADYQVLRGIRTVAEAFTDVGVDVDLEAGLDDARTQLD